MKTQITSKLFICIFIFSSLVASVKLIAQPANDLIVNAIDLSLGPVFYHEFDVDFPGATAPGDGGQQGCTTGVAGIWYKFTATAVGEIGAGLLNDDSGIIVFYTAPNENVTTGQELTYVDQAGNPCDNSNFALIETTIGTTYYIYMKNNIVSDVVINTEEIFAVPANDLIENATNINGLEDYFDDNVHMLMTTVTNDEGQNGCDTNGAVRAVWYKFTAGTNGQVVAGIGTPANASAIIFYSAANENATTGSDLTHVDQPSNPCAENNLASIDAVAGTTYYILAFTLLPWADVSINLSGVILGVADNTIEGFSYYPNPVASEINLSAKSAIDEITIYNLLGQKVLSEKPNSTRKVIDMSFLQTGLYIMHITSEGNSASYRLVKK